MVLDDVSAAARDTTAARPIAILLKRIVTALLVSTGEVDNCWWALLIADDM